MTASHGRRRSNTSPSTSQAPRTAPRPRCLWKVVPAGYPPIGERPCTGAESLGRPDRVDDRGRGTPTTSQYVCASRRRVVSDKHTSRFADRHIGPDAAAVNTMLEVIGVASLDELAAKALPAGILDALSSDGIAPGLEGAARAGHRGGVSGRAAGTRRFQHHGGLDDRPRLVSTLSLPPCCGAQHFLRTPPGTPRTRRTSRRSARAGSRCC